MKKLFILAAAAIVAMAACSKVETIDNTPDSPICFTVVNHLQLKTRADVTYPTTVPFGTFAWWTADDWTNIAADQTFVFMNNEQISWHSISASTSEVWAPENMYYWTKTGKITFASYSPYTAAGTDKGYNEIPKYNVTKGFLFNDYTIVNNTDVDLMWANLAANCTKTTNTDGTEVTNDSNPEGGYAGVPTIFNHALCQVGFAFRAIGTKNPNVSDIKIEVTDVDILNIDNKGSFTQIPAVTTPATPRWATDHEHYVANYDYAPAEALVLDLLDGSNANVVNANNYTPLLKNATDTDPYTRILLPQALLETAHATIANALEDIATTGDQKLVVKYTVKVKYTSAPDDWATEDVVSTVRLNNGNITAWADNQSITYRISINPYATIPVTFDPAITDWDPVASTDVNINEFDD